MIKRLRKDEKGFTLMELVIVIVILGILALIAVPRLLGFANQAEKATDEEYAAVVGRAAELYYASHKRDTGFDGSTDVTVANMEAEDMVKAGFTPEYYATITLACTDDGVITVTCADGESAVDYVWTN